MNDKLIHVNDRIRPGGGPPGYLFNLRRALQVAAPNEPANFDIMSLDNSLERNFDAHLSPPTWRAQLINRLPKYIGLKALYSRERRRWDSNLDDGFVGELCDYKAIVFHDVQMARRYLTHHKILGQRIFIMSHSPVDYATDRTDNWRMRFGDSRLLEKIHEEMSSMEVQTYLLSDGLLAPSNRAYDAYFRRYTLHKEEFSKVVQYEIASGVAPLQVKVPQSKIASRRANTIPDDSLAVGYFGRYHPQKGFDVFLNTVREMSSNPNVFFVSAGGGPIFPNVQVTNYRDLGWLNEDLLPNTMNAVDIVVVPNRVSYFDLIVLEAMSLGKMVITSNVGGNTGISASGVVSIPIKDQRDLVAAIQRITKAEAEKMGQENLEVFKREYALKPFYERHQTFAKRVVAERDLWKDERL